MKKLLLFFLTILFSFNLFATPVVPYSQADEDMFERNVQALDEYAGVYGNASGFVKIADLDGDTQGACTTTQVKYDVSVTGGTSGTTYTLGMSLPAKAYIKGTWYHISTAFTASGGDSKLAFQCEDAGNLLTATAMSGFSADTLHDGAVAAGGASSTWVKDIAAECDIKTVVTDGDFIAGVLLFDVEWCQHL